ncbi:MAG: citrate lyase subunit alpha, partial [Treponema sp.]|nr:citrate lyase subunit alpha [Treponema sp.]
MTNISSADLAKIPGIAEMNRVFRPTDYEALEKDNKTLAEREKTLNKIVSGLEEAVRLTNLQNGQTISFHHHFREGDYIVNMVIDKLAEMGFK